MSEKTLLKLYENGDVESFVPINQNENLFERDKSVSGYIDISGFLAPSELDDVTSDFISVKSDEMYVIDINWTIVRPGYWFAISYYTNDYEFISSNTLHDSPNSSFKDIISFPSDVRYVRISVEYSNNMEISFKKNNVSFSENSIKIPQIIEYPPNNYRNYYIEKTSVSGYINRNGAMLVADEYDRTSDFIDVRGWEFVTVRIEYENLTGSLRAWLGVASYYDDKRFYRSEYDEYLTSQGKTGDFVIEIGAPVRDVSFIRISLNLVDHPRTNVKISVEKGRTSTEKHYLAFEDMPSWVRNTENPISIFKEGIVIKGNTSIK